MTKKPAEKDQDRYMAEFIEAKNRLAKTKYLFMAAIVLWPLGLFHSALMSLAIFAITLALASVSSYIAFMHYITAKKRVDYPKLVR